MSMLIIIIGLLIVLAGVSTLVNPKIVIGSLQNNLDRPAMHIGAVLGRLVIGALLVFGASQSKFPLTLELLGWLFIFTAIGLALIGNKKFKRLGSWALAKAATYARVTGIFVAAFGGFLVHAFS